MYTTTCPRDPRRTWRPRHGPAFKSSSARTPHGRALTHRADMRALAARTPRARKACAAGPSPHGRRAPGGPAPRGPRRTDAARPEGLRRGALAARTPRARRPCAAPRRTDAARPEGLRRGALAARTQRARRACAAGPSPRGRSAPGGPAPRGPSPRGRSAPGGPGRVRLSASPTASSLGANLGVRGPAGGATESSARDIVGTTPDTTASATCLSVAPPAGHRTAPGCTGVKPDPPRPVRRPPRDPAHRPATRTATRTRPGPCDVLRATRPIDPRPEPRPGPKTQGPDPGPGPCPEPEPEDQRPVRDSRSYAFCASKWATSRTSASSNMLWNAGEVSRTDVIGTRLCAVPWYTKASAGAP
jgi:hypothetical protein